MDPGVGGWGGVFQSGTICISHSQRDLNHLEVCLHSKAMQRLCNTKLGIDCFPSASSNGNGVYIKRVVGGSTGSSSEHQPLKRSLSKSITV